jgi:hypothetical protein
MIPMNCFLTFLRQAHKVPQLTVAESGSHIVHTGNAFLDLAVWQRQFMFLKGNFFPAFGKIVCSVVERLRL